mgnify:CR=1 FL=1
MHMVAKMLIITLCRHITHLWVEERVNRVVKCVVNLQTEASLPGFIRKFAVFGEHMAIKAREVQG